MAEWPKFQSLRFVQAAKIVSIHGTADPGPIVILVDPGNGTRESFETTDPGMMKRCNVGDYAMLYPDGVKSVQPKEAFEDNYAPV